jgi:hypothetical protein
MNRHPGFRDKAAHWAVWSVVAVLCAALFFQANRTSSSRAFGTDVPVHGVQGGARAGAGTSAADTLLW